LSKLVADYFLLLMAGKSTARKTGAPVTRSLRGVLKGARADRESYHLHLDMKHR